MLNFKINNDNNENKNQINSLDQILLSKNNLRFTLINSLNENLLNFLIENTNANNQKEIFERLFYNEGDLSDLKRLLENIKIYGFENKTENIYLVPLKNNSFVVAEGNRRTMCLKLITNKFDLPSLEMYLQKNEFYTDENTEKLQENEISDADTKKKIEKNYKEIVGIINEIKQKNINWEINCEIINDQNYLWMSIYDKHLTGERPGMRKWSRGKYFADLLSVFPNGIYENQETNNFIKNIRREKDYIIRDFKEAEFIYLCFYFGKNFNISEELISIEWNKKFDDTDILNEILKSNRISALEKTHSFNKIRKIFCEEILGLKNNIEFNIFEEKYLSVEYDKKNIISVVDKEINKDKFFKFIYDKWKDRIITTRPIRKEELKDFINDLRLILYDIDFDKQIPQEKLNEINAFSLSKDKIDKIISHQKLYYTDDYIKRFKTARSIIDNNDKIIEGMKNKKLNSYKNAPLSVFEILSNQLEHNCKENNVFLNAVFSTIRSFFEQFLIWIEYFTFSDVQDNEKILHIKNMSENEVNKMVNDSKTGIRIKFIKNKSELSKLISKIIKNGTENINYVKICEELHKILESKIWNKIINENIHSSHRIYLKSTYEENLIAYNEFQKLVLLLIDEIDFSIFENLNKKVENYILENNKKIS